LSDYECLVVERHERVGWLEFNRPEVSNAMDAQMLDELEVAWQELDSDPRVSVIVNIGRGKAFQTGLDMVQLSREPEALRKQSGRTKRSELRMTATQNGVAKPVVVAVNGVCAGGGLHFVADADLVIASSDASWLDPHVSVGQVASYEAIGLARRISFEAVIRMALVGRHERMSADRALSLGMISQIVDPPENLREEAQELAERIARNSPAAMRATKRALWGALEQGLTDASRAGAAELVSMWGHPDQTEGPLAFAEKREPVWLSLPGPEAPERSVPDTDAHSTRTGSPEKPGHGSGDVKRSAGDEARTRRSSNARASNARSSIGETVYECLKIERQGPVGWLINNRPERLNAMNSAMRDEFAYAWQELDADPAVRVIVHTGEGKAFQTGVDVMEIASDGVGMERYRESMETFDLKFTAWQNQVWKPVITAVNGICAGGGFHWIADADLVIASSDAEFFDPHPSVGQVASLELIGLARRMPFEAVMRMALVGRHERMSADRALSLGMISQIVDPPENLREEAQELAERIARNSPAAMRATKRALWGALEQGLSDASRAGAAELVSMWGHPDQTEGPLAFAEKRDPVWLSPERVP